jgi:cytochrome c5
MGRVGVVVVGGVLVALAGAGCQSSAPVSRADLVAQAQRMTPADPKLAGLYAQSCKQCHTLADSGAPLTGDRAGWDARWAKGLPALVKSTVTGLGGMPPGGQCFSCSQADLQALITFMAGRE